MRSRTHALKSRRATRTHALCTTCASRPGSKQRCCSAAREGAAYIIHSGLCYLAVKREVWGRGGRGETGLARARNPTGQAPHRRTHKRQGAAGHAITAAVRPRMSRASSSASRLLPARQAACLLRRPIAPQNRAAVPAVQSRAACTDGRAGERQLLPALHLLLTPRQSPAPPRTLAAAAARCGGGRAPGAGRRAAR